jgi:hypothetical protein
MVILILTLAIFIPLIFSVRKLPKIYLMWGTALIFLYLIVSYINGLVYTFPPLRVDALKFHQFMVNAAENPQERVSFFSSMTYNYLWYPSRVSYLYVLKNSILVGQSCSIFAYACSIPLLYFFLKKLNHEQYAVPALLVFSLDPMHLLNRVGCLRESWELLLFMWAVWFYSEILDRKSPIKNVVLLALVLFLGEKLHYVFGYMSAIFLLALIYSLILGKNRAIMTKVDTRKLIVSIAIAASIVIILFWHELSDVVSAILAKHIERPLWSFRDKTIHTLYIDPNISYGPIACIVYFIKYMFYPFPWAIRTTTDLFAFFCICIRSMLLFCALWGSFSGSIEQKRAFQLILFPCLAVAFVYSQGVFNYGTAFRHQILTYWGLVILGLPVMLDFLKNKNCLSQSRVFFTKTQ